MITPSIQEAIDYFKVNPIVTSDTKSMLMARLIDFASFVSTAQMPERKKISEDDLSCNCGGNDFEKGWNVALDLCQAYIAKVEMEIAELKERLNKYEK